MSASVWYGEVCAGLRKEIEDTVRIRDRRREFISLPHPLKSIVVRKPEEDLKFEVFPCVSIYIKSFRHDPLRYDPQCVQLVRDPTTYRTQVEEQAVPYNLDVQLDFWAKYQEDIDNMTRTWLMKHFRQFNLDVVDDGGTPRSISVLSVGGMVKSDLVLGEKRLFHSILNYSIWVEIDGEMRYNVPMVTKVELNTIQEVNRKEEIS